jgi:hypothetical protein
LKELKKEAKEVPRREARRINKMVADYEKSKKTQTNPEAPKPTNGPKVCSHGQNKYREKTRGDDQWGPLGW